MCKGEIQSDSTKTKKIIVIDDPISSLSHIYVFNIGRIIQNEFFKTTKYEQIFVLTHSLYFFYELTNLKNDEREKTQALFRIIKNNTGSSFVKMKYEEIQNDLIRSGRHPAAHGSGRVRAELLWPPGSEAGTDGV